MSNYNCTFSFKFETKGKFFELIETLSSNKATQHMIFLSKFKRKIVRFAHIYYTITSLIICLLKVSLTP